MTLELLLMSIRFFSICKKYFYCAVCFLLIKRSIRSCTQWPWNMVPNWLSFPYPKTVWTMSIGSTKKSSNWTSNCSTGRRNTQTTPSFSICTTPFPTLKPTGDGTITCISPNWAIKWLAKCCLKNWMKAEQIHSINERWVSKWHKRCWQQQHFVLWPAKRNEKKRHRQKAYQNIENNCVGICFPHRCHQSFPRENRFGKSNTNGTFFKRDFNWEKKTYVFPPTHWKRDESLSANAFKTALAAKPKVHKPCKMGF